MGISIGLVGLGRFGSGFADLYRSHPLVDRIALCDIEPDRIAKFASKESWQSKFSPADAYASLDEICASDLDALVIITQPWLHAPQCIQAMESGKHVYSAVPLISLPDGDEILDWCDKLVSTAQSTGMSYMLGETTYYRPQTMYARRQAAAGAFGDYVYAEGEYFHPFDGSCDLREVRAARVGSTSGREWLEIEKQYTARGKLTGPMHYPTHSVSGPMCVMNAHAVKVCAWGYANKTDEPYFADVPFSNETALFQMSNGATMRICEHREIGHCEREILRVYGTKGSFENDQWCTNRESMSLTIDEMRDSLPEAVADAFMAVSGESDIYGGHGGSHTFLVNEFVDAVASGRQPAVSVYDAARYMAAGVTAHKSALRDGELFEVPDWGDGEQ